MDFQIGGLPPQLGAMFAGETQASRMASDETNRLGDLERILASRQNRDFQAQEQPFTLEKMRQDNLTRQLANQDNQFKAGVRDSLGKDFYTEAERTKQTDVARKSLESFSNLITEVGAEVQGLPPERRVAHVKQRLEAMKAPKEIVDSFTNIDPNQMPLFFASRAENLRAMLPKTGTQIQTTQMKETGATDRNNDTNDTRLRIAQLRAATDREIAHIRAQTSASARAGKGAAAIKNLDQAIAIYTDKAINEPDPAKAAEYRRGADELKRHKMDIAAKFAPKPDMVPSVDEKTGRLTTERVERPRVTPLPTQGTQQQPTQQAAPTEGWSARMK